MATNINMGGSILKVPYTEEELSWNSMTQITIPAGSIISIPENWPVSFNFAIVTKVRMWRRENPDA